MRKTWSKRRKAKFELVKALTRKKQQMLEEQAAAFAELAAEKAAKEYEERVRETNQDIVPFDDSPLGTIVVSDE